MLQKIKIDKELVRQRFSRTLSSYSGNAVVQKTMAAELSEMICREMTAGAFERVLEVGSGSGLLMAELLNRCSVKSYYANDLVEESLYCLRKVLERFAVEKFHFIAGDIECSDVLPSELDLVVSNATLQWLDDLDDFFRTMSIHLRPGGLLAFSTFSTSNMQEIASIEDVGLCYHTLDELEILAGRYFDLTFSREDEQRIEFSTPDAMLHHIRKTGVNGLLRRSWTKSRYQYFLAEYQRLFSCENGVYLTYHPVYCCLKKKLL